MARTVVDLDERILARARELTGIKKKVDLVNHALHLLVEQKELEEIFKLRGKVRWEGDLAAMRQDRRDSR